MQALDKTGFTYAISSLWNKICSKNSATQTSIDTHIADKANSHGVTVAQAGVEASTTNGNITQRKNTERSKNL